MSDEKLEPPSQSKFDAAYAMAKAGLSIIPIVGGPVAELLPILLQQPLERRRKEWMTRVGEKLQELESRGVNITEICQSEEFISAVMHTTQIALRTHQAEKRDALRNAVFNIAAGQSPGEALEYIFFDWIESMSALHIQILKIFQHPKVPPGPGMKDLKVDIEYNMPSLRGQCDLYCLIWRDLFSKGLLNNNDLDSKMSAGFSKKCTTDIGDKFIQFITEPTL
jgi:hypothetical protein